LQGLGDPMTTRDFVKAGYAWAASAMIPETHWFRLSPWAAAATAAASWISGEK